MSKVKYFACAALLVAAAVAPTLAEARHYRHYHHTYWPLPYQISYLHNYGPGLEPGTFAYYDGPSNNACYRGAANYRGQDGGRYPCF